MAQHSLPVLPALPFHTFPQPQRSVCSREFPESRWGAGDAVACTRTATIYDFATEQEYCFECWREVGRG
jgi:hypothetical protein